MTWWKQNTHCLIFYDAINHLLIYNRLSIDYNDCRHSGKAASVLMWFRAMQFFQCCFQECNRVVPLHRRNTLVTVPLRPFSISVRPHNVQREKKVRDYISGVSFHLLPIQWLPTMGGFQGHVWHRKINRLKIRHNNQLF